jgi:hypothetical protein
MSENEIDWNYRSDEYLALMHAMQSGIKFKMELEGTHGSSETSPKHLRTGVNSALIDCSALVKTLVEAGVITIEDYRDNLIELLVAEVNDYQEKLSAKMGGANIKLG